MAAAAAALAADSLRVPRTAFPWPAGGVQEAREPQRAVSRGWRRPRREGRADRARGLSAHLWTRSRSESASRAPTMGPTEILRTYARA